MGNIKYKCWPARERNLDIETDEETHHDKVFVRDIEFPAGMLSWFREDLSAARKVLKKSITERFVTEN